MYARIGVRDAASFTQACLRGYAPNGVVVGVTEKHAIASARRATNGTTMDFVVDPLVPRLSFLSFTRTKTLRELEYSPDGVEPFQAADFKSRDERRSSFARCFAIRTSAARRACSRRRSRCAAPTIAPIAVNAKLLDFAVVEATRVRQEDHRAGAARLDAIATTDAQTELVNRLRRG